LRAAETQLQKAKLNAQAVGSDGTVKTSKNVMAALQKHKKSGGVSALMVASRMTDAGATRKKEHGEEYPRRRAKVQISFAK
jgi:hypothetical protein